LRGGFTWTVCLSAALAVSPALGAFSDFLPKPSVNGAYLDIFASREQDKTTGTGRQFEWSDTFLKEKLTVFSNGYFYHPRFLQFQLSFSGLLTQESYSALSAEPVSRRRGSGYEYDGKLLLLPQHPYNLEIYALRYEPLFKERSAAERDTIQTRRGAFFQYRKAPFSAHARYSTDLTDSAESSSKVTRAGVDGEYVKRFTGGKQFSLNASGSPMRFSNSYGLNGNSEEFLLTSTLDLERARLSCSASQSSFDQDSDLSGRTKSNHLAFYEVATAELPFNLRTELSYRLQNNENRSWRSSAGDVKLTDEDRKSVV
jgi:hypothetical protein